MVCRAIVKVGQWIRCRTVQNPADTIRTDTKSRTSSSHCGMAAAFLVGVANDPVERAHPLDAIAGTMGSRCGSSEFPCFVFVTRLDVFATCGHVGNARPD